MVREYRTLRLLLLHLLEILGTSPVAAVVGEELTLGELPLVVLVAQVEVLMVQQGKLNQLLQPLVLVAAGVVQVIAAVVLVDQPAVAMVVPAS